MAKEIIAHIKLQIPAGQANPAPPVGTALGPRGVNIMAFCKEFNAATQKQAGDILPVVITVFKDKSFPFITKSPPAAVLLKKAANIAAGSKEPNKTKVGKVTRKQIMEIVKTKAKDLNSRSDEAGLRWRASGFYVKGAVAAIFVSFLIFHFVFMLGFSFMPESAWNPPPKPAT